MAPSESGSTPTEAQPTPSVEAEPSVEGPPTSRLSSLRIGPWHACVVSDRRHVLCWGEGVEPGAQSAAEDRVAQRIDLGQGQGPDAPMIVDLSVGDGEVCALFDDHHRRCASFNAPDEPPTSTRVGDEVVKIATWPKDSGVKQATLDTNRWLDWGGSRVAGVTDFVTEPDSGSCLLNERGEVRCWYGSMRDEDYERRLGPVAGGIAIRNAERPCVLTEAGEAWCMRVYSVLHPDEPAGSGYEYAGKFLQVPTRSGAPIVDLARSAIHLCALERGGEVWCRGANGGAGLATGDTSPHEGQHVVPLPGPASEIEAYEEQTCAIAGNQVLCWGAQFTRAYEQAIVEIETSALHLSQNFTCVTPATGPMQCWGQLGYENDDLGAEPRPRVVRSRLGPVDDYYSMFGGSSGVLLSQGTLELGWHLLDQDGWPTNGRYEVRQSWSKVESFLYSPRALCVLNASAKLVCWTEAEGQDEFVVDKGMPARAGVTALYGDIQQVCAVAKGKLACAATEADVRRPGWQKVPGLGRVVAVGGAEKRSTCAVLEDGGVQCWRAEHGPKGLELVRAPFALEVEDALDLVVGRFGVCVMTKAGAVHCGPDGAEQLELAIERGAIEIDASRDHWCARLDRDGDGRSEAVACQGANHEGQLGQVGGHVMLSPTPIELGLP